MTGSALAMFAAYYVVETAVTHTVIDTVKHSLDKKKDNTIRTKVPANKPKIKLEF
ncbi:hypothetical protein [Bacillus atrophaeus]|uniref:hypothetical protein n=1 Tax=Bacillus atrophaeus TaxID=1452 RepID=UPI002E1C41DD|nr:hypothetical protein [Bacillus atrophaeus]